MLKGPNKFSIKIYNIFFKKVGTTQILKSVVTLYTVYF